MVVGISLVALLALLIGMLFAGVWRHLTRQLTRGGLVVFLIGAGIATVEAQKLKAGYVDASVAESGDGSSWEKAVQTISELSGRMTYGGTVYVKPGEYTGDFMFPARYEGPHEQFSMIAVGGPEKTVITGGSIFYMSEVLTLEWQCLHIKGFTLKALDSPISQALIEDCRLTGFADTIVWDSDLSSCLIDNNTNGEYTLCAIEGCNLYNCTVVGEIRSGRLAGSAEHWDSIYDGGNNLYSKISGGGDVFFNYRNNYIQDENMTSYRLADPCFVDRATDGVVCAHSPAVGFGEAFSAEAYRAEFWKVFNGDIDGRAMVIEANGKTLVGAFQQTVVRSVVTLNEPTNGGLALEKGEFGENVLYEGDELVIVSAPGTRPCDGVTINGTTNILFETAPEHKIVLTCDVLGSGDSFTVVPRYTTDWFVDDDGDDGNSGGYPSASRKTLATTAALLSSGDTLHVLPGEYRTGTTEAKELPCRVVVKQGTRVVSTDGPEVTFICGETGVRCARVEKNAELSGFTLKSADITASGKTGAAVIGSGDTGGRSPANGHKVSDCIIAGNRGQWPVYSCLLIRSRVTGNAAVTSTGGNAALCYQISAYGSYFAGNTCLRVFDYSLDMHDITIAADNLTLDGESAGATVAGFVLSILQKGRIPKVPTIGRTYVIGGTFPR